MVDPVPAKATESFASNGVCTKTNKTELDDDLHHQWWGQINCILTFYLLVFNTAARWNKLIVIVNQFHNMHIYYYHLSNTCLSQTKLAMMTKSKDTIRYCINCCWSTMISARIAPSWRLVVSWLATTYTHTHTHTHTHTYLSLIHIWRCRRSTLCRSRWSPYH